VTIHSRTALLHVFFAFMLWRAKCQQKWRQQNDSDTVSMNIKSTINWKKQESEGVNANKT